MDIVLQISNHLKNMKNKEISLDLGAIREFRLN